MSDDPFTPRLEDHVNRALKAGLSVVLPSAIMEYVQWVVGDPAQERRDDFIKDLYERLTELSGRYEALQPDRLRSNPAFQSSFLQAAQAAMRTAQSEKREMLRNAIINSALAGDLDENIRHMFLQCVDRLTALHVGMLKLLDAPEEASGVNDLLERLSSGSLLQVIEVAIPQLQGKREIAKLMSEDLASMGLLQSGGFGTTMTAQGMRARRTTELGRAFLQFIADPATGNVP